MQAWSDLRYNLTVTFEYQKKEWSCSHCAFLYVFRKLSCRPMGDATTSWTYTLYIGFPFLSTNWWDWMLNNVWHEFPYCCDAPVLTNVTVWPRFSESFYFIFLFWYHKPILFWFLSSNSELRIFRVFIFFKVSFTVGKVLLFLCFDNSWD